jgi:glutathione-regulated potassium-efflux system ancillary protein KefG
MPRRVLVDDLIDAHDVAAILGLSHRNTVSKYQSRYPDMPRPVVDLGPGRPMLWLRPQIERWNAKTVAEGRTRLGRRPSRSRPPAASGPTGREG